MSDFHRQCKLKNGTKNYTAWIPEENARKGNMIIIDGVGDYVVVSVGTKMETEKVNRQAERARSGIFDSIK